MQGAAYIGRFAPSPTGPLHAGSLVAAMASYLDARVHAGRWLVRIEDVDMARTVPGAADDILHTLELLGMRRDGEVMVQSTRFAAYDDALRRLSRHIYACGCSRREIADSRLGTGPDGAPIYPGTCRSGLSGKPARAVRLHLPEPSDPAATIAFDDRWQGRISQNLPSETGDFVLRRADGYWAYQLAVVVDDAAQGITDVVRGEDLLGSTPRQIYLQRLLGLPVPRYLHVPVMRNALGEKLSKQTGALALDTDRPLETLIEAARFLGLPADWDGVRSADDSLAAFWKTATEAWKRRLTSLPCLSANGC